MRKIIIPKELESFGADWTFNSLEFENAIARTDNFLDFALKILYRNKAPILKTKIIQRIEDGKYTNKKLKQYENAIANNCRDLRYLCPYYLILYFVARSRAETFHSEGLIAQAFSTMTLMSFCAGALTELAESGRDATPDYTDDPIRAEIATTAANATHAGSKVIQNRVIELIKAEKTPEWTTKKGAATTIEKLIIDEFYILNNDASKKNRAEYIPRPDLDFKLNLQASALHDRILKWMGKGREGVKPLNQAITEALKHKSK